MVVGSPGKKIIRIPGEKICSISEGEPGEGVYERNGFIYASLTGIQVIQDRKDVAATSHSESDSQAPLIQVIPSAQTVRTFAPEIGQIVICRVTMTNSRLCKCDVVGIDGHFLPTSHPTAPALYHGFIRKEDIRASDKDRVDISKSFRPGDVILAKVLSYGDSYSYALTTAENELGVVFALGQHVNRQSQLSSRAPMLPLSWCEMICPVTLNRESRKVARAQPRYLENYQSQTE